MMNVEKINFLSSKFEKIFYNIDRGQRMSIR